ncbi:hypothetical protein SEVIR_8G204450v4 [Setaria viridis]
MMLYEFMPNGSLWEALHGPRTGVSRYDVVAGVAQGLAYLHHDCHPPVIHRDIKSNNILLDASIPWWQAGRQPWRLDVVVGPSWRR